MTQNFRERCYEKLRQVPAGYVITYQALAHALGTKAYRAVGTAMAQNPDIPQTPCHRVVRSDGSVGEYAHGSDQKIRLLQAEGVVVVKGKVDLTQFGYEF